MADSRAAFQAWFIAFVIDVFVILLAGYKLERQRAAIRAESKTAIVMVAVCDMMASGMKNQKAAVIPTGSPIAPPAKTRRKVSNRITSVTVFGLVPKARIMPKSLR